MRGGLFLFLAMLFVVAPARGFPAYHDISDRQAAQAEAKQRNLPLAWVGGYVADLSVSVPEANSDADLEQMAMSNLDGKAVIIFFEGNNMAPVPPIVHAQCHIRDDGPLPGGAAWDPPKVVFTDPDVTKILGRVSHTQMAADRFGAISSALQKIQNDPAALEPVAPPPVVEDPRPPPETVAPPPSEAETTPAPASDAGPVSGGPFMGMSLDEFVNKDGFGLALVVIVLIALVACLRPSS